MYRIVNFCYFSILLICLFMMFDVLIFTVVYKIDEKFFIIRKKNKHKCKRKYTDYYSGFV